MGAKIALDPARIGLILRADARASSSAHFPSPASWRRTPWFIAASQTPRENENLTSDTPFATYFSAHGSLGGPPGRNQTVNFAWTADDRDRISYGALALPVIPPQQIG
jgi:hypothetical protein